MSYHPRNKVSAKPPPIEYTYRQIFEIFAAVQSRRGATVSQFPQLRELELVVNWTNLAYEALLSSITSTELRKVIFSVRDRREWDVYAERLDVWILIDRLLCELVARLGGMGQRHTLEVELRLTGVEIDVEKRTLFTMILPEFRSIGVVTIIDVDPIYGDRILHSSTHRH